MAILKFSRTVFCATFLLFAVPAAHGDPDDLTLESFTDEYPDGKKKMQEDSKTADDRAKELAEQPYKEKENTFFVQEEALVQDQKPEVNPEDFLCRSTKEYIETLAFLRKTDVIILTETTSRRIADRVSKSCDGGGMRFIKVLTLLKRMGLSDKRSVQIGLEFAGYPAEIQRNFLAIFTQTYLGEFFDYDYRTAVELAFELSKNYKGNPNEMREDFIELVRFCKDGKKLDLPARVCAEYTVRVARLSQYFPQGVRASFYKLYNHFRQDKAFNMNVKLALGTTFNILQYGPRAAENFFSAYEYASSKSGLEMGHPQALEFAVKMASRSFRGDEPPIVSPGYSVKVIQRAVTSIR